MKSIFKPGFVFKLSCRPSVVIYVAENKTLAGKEDRTYDGEAIGGSWPLFSSSLLMGTW